MNTPEEIKKAMEWWQGRTFEENFISVIKHLGHDHNVGLLTQSQILEVYQKTFKK